MDVFKRNLRTLVTGDAAPPQPQPPQVIYVQAPPEQAPQQEQQPPPRRQNSGGAFDEDAHADAYARSFGRFREYNKRYGS